MREYANAIQDCVAARAIWEPGVVVQPGDYGEIHAGCFVRLGSVSELGVRLRPAEVSDEGRFEFSRGVDARLGVSATTAVEWTGDAVASVDWAGGAGVFLGGSNSKLLTIADLGRVVREAISSQQWGFNWRLVRQVRALSEGVIILGGTSATAGKLVLNSKIPAHDGKLSADGRRSDGFLLMRRGLSGSVYAHTVRLKPWLTRGSVPLDHEVWYDDDFDD